MECGDRVIYVLDPASRPIAGALVTITDDGQTRLSDGNGFTHMWACGDWDIVRFEARGWQTTERSLPLGEHRVHLEREPIVPGPHPDPVVGAIRTDGNLCFRDDTGCRNFVIAHMGDLAARFIYALVRNDQVQLEEAKADIAAAHDAGYHIIRTWWRFDDIQGSPWYVAAYPGLEPAAVSDFVRHGAELLQYIAAQGMRTAVGPGGVDAMNTAQEEEMFRLLGRVIAEAGPETVAWLEALNEPSSTHATSDNNGDNTPEHLTHLVRVAQEHGATGVLWHLGYWTNNNYDEASRYCVSGTSYNYVHGWRGGNTFNKIDRRFTWDRIFAQETGKSWCRLTIDGESVGWPVSGPPLQYVSATENGAEMSDPEALGLIAVATAVRGIPSHMSGTGVQRYEPFTEAVGWREIPWIARQLPRDVATFALLHGGQSGDSRLLVEATTNSAGVLARADQALANDGRFVVLVYNQVPNQTQAFRFRRRAEFKSCDITAMSCTDHVVEAGQLFNVRMFWGRVLIGQSQ